MNKSKRGTTRFRPLWFCMICGIAGAIHATHYVAAEETVPSLEGTNWQLVKLTVLGGFTFTPDQPGDYVLNFRSDNRLTGESDCNSLGGLWFQDATALHFDPFYTSRKLCPPGSLHNNLVLYLKDVTSMQVRDTHLILRTDAEGIEMEYESRD